MPYMVKDEGVDKVDERWCVYKKGEDGQPEGKPLGCHPSKEKADAQIAAICANEARAILPEMHEMRFRPGGAIRALEGRRLEVLACPNGSPDDLDHLNEYFTARTEFMIETGDRRPTLYFHGFTPDKRMTARPAPIGIATATRRDEKGLWMEVELSPGAMSDRIWKAAEAGTCRASTGAVNYLCRPITPEKHKEPIELEVWPIGELSLLDKGLGRVPVNDKAVAMPLRASFEALDLEIPEAFGEDAGSRDETAQPVTWVETPTHTATGESEMATEVEVVPKATEEKKVEVSQSAIEMAVKAVIDRREAEAKAVADAEAAMRAKILKEMEGEPKYKAIFTTPKETKGASKLSPEEQETHEYIWRLRNRDPMLSAPVSMRAGVFTETDAVEGLPLVPPDLVNKIHEKRDIGSFGRAAGMTIYTTDKLILNIPTETTKMVALATIAEEGIYTEDVPALATVAATTVKKGGFVYASEEFLEDQDLFQGFLVRAIGRAWGLAENVELAAKILAVTGTSIANHAVLTDPEVLAWFYRLPRVYRDGAVFLMADADEAYLRAKLITTPRAYGDLGFAAPLGPSGTGGETFLGHRVYGDAVNFPGLAAANDGVEFASFINMGEAIAFVERRGLKIQIDPYSDMLHGIVRYYFSARFVAVVVNSDALTNLQGETT